MSTLTPSQREKPQWWRTAAFAPCFCDFLAGSDWPVCEAGYWTRWIFSALIQQDSSYISREIMDVVWISEAVLSLVHLAKYCLLWLAISKGSLKVLGKGLFQCLFPDNLFTVDVRDWFKDLLHVKHVPYHWALGTLTVWSQRDMD